MAELTLLLHRAYARHAERGLKYFASHQDADETLKRVARGECYLAIHDGRMTGTITWCDPARARGSPWYDRPDVASFGQFAVDPPWQGRGIGSRLLELVENRAAACGATELALDTAEGADDLIRYYTKRGFRFIEYVQWEVVNYRSALLSKTLTPTRQSEG